MDKKLRFGDLVRNSGRPHVVTLWVKPEKDPRLTTAIKQNRVLTVIQQPGKRDYGTVGFHINAGALYLVFPRPLPREGNAKVIGIKYQLVEVPESKPAPPDPAPPLAKRQAPSVSSKPQPSEPEPLAVDRPKPKPALQKPGTKKFKVKLRRTACVEKDLTIDAPNKKAAERQALEAVQKEPFAFDEAKVGVQVVKTD
jgi:hypothetical protein